MKREKRKILVWAAGLLAAFLLWTGLVCLVDVQPIGPRGSEVGLATMNGFVWGALGLHMTLYTVTDWLGLVPLGIVVGFGILGLIQWIRRKSLRNVDGSILLLGGFYLLVLALFALFEAVPVNNRPVLIEGVLETSYPSSTTMLTLCVMPTAWMQWDVRIRNRQLRRWVGVAVIGFTVFMVLGRLISGVHWVSDIIGGGLLSAGLVTLYAGLKK